MQAFTRALKNVKECERQPKELQPPNQSIEGLITCKKYLKITPAEYLDQQQDRSRKPCRYRVVNWEIDRLSMCGIKYPSICP